MEKLKVEENGDFAWVICPICRRGKILKVRADTRATRLSVFCKFCRRERMVDIAESVRAPGGVCVTLSQYVNETRDNSRQIQAV